MQSRKISILLVLLVAFIDLMGIGLVYPMFSSMLFGTDCQMLPADSSHAWRGTCLGVLLATMPLFQFFSAPILGMLSDQKGRRKILIPSLAIGVLGYFLAVFAVSIENLLLLLLSRVAVGISAGTSSVVGAAMADLSKPEEKAKNFGLFSMACGLGFTVGPFLGGMLSTTSLGFIEGYSIPFLIAGIMTLINLVLIAFCFAETYAVKENTDFDIMAGVKNIQKAFKIKTLRTVFLSVFIGCAGWSFYWEFTPVTWIGDYNFDTATIGTLYAYGAIIFAVSSGFLIRPIVNRFSTERVLFSGLIMCGLSIGVFLIHMDPFWLWVYLPFQQYAMALFWPSAATLVSNSVGDEVQGEMIGVLHSVDALAFALSPLVAGPLLGLSTQTPIIIGASAMFLAAFILRGALKAKEVVKVTS